MGSWRGITEKRDLEAIRNFESKPSHVSSFISPAIAMLFSYLVPPDNGN